MLMRKVWPMYVWKFDKLIIVTDSKFNALFYKVSSVIDFIIIILHHFSPLFKLVNINESKNKTKGKLFCL